MAISPPEAAPLTETKPDVYVRQGVSDAERHAQGEIGSRTPKGRAMGYLDAGEHLPNYAPIPKTNGRARVIATGWISKHTGGIMPQLQAQEGAHESVEQTPDETVEWPAQPNEWNGTDETSRVRPEVDEVSIEDEAVVAPEQLVVGGLGKAVENRAAQDEVEPHDERPEEIGAHYLG